MRIQNKKHGIYRVNGGKEYKASRLGGLERVREGEKANPREREKRRKTDLFKQTLMVMFRVWPVRRSFLTDRCFFQQT